MEGQDASKVTSGIHCPVKVGTHQAWRKGGVRPFQWVVDGGTRLWQVESLAGGIPACMGDIDGDRNTK